jgi:carbon monoxide dehydrogenase subunit G
MMRIEDTFEVRRPPEDVFAYLTDPERLPEWQTSTVEVRRERGGPLEVGERFSEVHAALGRRLESTVEVAESTPPSAFALKILDGAMPLDGRWTFAANGDGTRVHFVGEANVGGLKRLARPMLARQFRRYHELLTKRLEGTGEIADR